MFKQVHLYPYLMLAMGGLIGCSAGADSSNPHGQPGASQAERPSAAKVGETTADGMPVGEQEVLPHPQQPFQGKIGRTAADSTPDFPKPLEAPKGAPNVLLIMTDDVGWGASSTFGGPISTPMYDKLAKSGLRFNQFHTTALCSPTRGGAHNRA